MDIYDLRELLEERDITAEEMIALCEELRDADRNEPVVLYTEKQRSRVRNIEVYDVTDGKAYSYGYGIITLYHDENRFEFRSVLPGLKKTLCGKPDEGKISSADDLRSLLYNEALNTMLDFFNGNKVSVVISSECF